MATNKSTRAAHANEKRMLRRRIRSFKRHYLFIDDAHEHRSLGVEGIFMDHKKDRPRAIILYSSDGPLPRLRSAARGHFAHLLFKLVLLKGPVKGSAALPEGTNILRDAAFGQGTIGGWLQRKSDGATCGFSNNHVIALANAAPVGSPLFRAGVRIGNLVEFVPLLDPPLPNQADFAVFTVAPGTTGCWQNGAPTSIIAARDGLNVTKHGFATGTTIGVLRTVEGALRVQLAGRTFLFDGLYAVPNNFAAEGDSGALVRLSSNGGAVGIQFAHATGSDYSYIFPIKGNAQLASLWNKYDWAAD